MNSKRVFEIALLVSVAIHVGIFVQGSGLSLFSRPVKEQKLELTYVKVPKKDTQADAEKKRSIRTEPLLNTNARITMQKNNPPPFMNKESAFNPNKAISSPSEVFNKPVLIKPDIIAVKKKITLPPVDLDKIDNPSYISYYQIVREKIRRSAYQNYSRQETGEVYISFIITRAGMLAESRLVEEKSSTSDYLKQVALSSLRDAAPFPAFPAELDYPLLSFNVVISFEIE